MGKPFKLSLVSDVRDFLKGIGSVEDALEEAADSLDSLSGAGDSLESSLTATAKSAAKELDAVGSAGLKTGKTLDRGLETADKAISSTADETKKLERKFSDAAKSLRSDSKSAGRAIGTEIQGGTSKAAEGLDEFKDEANQTAREAAASFSGSFDDIQDMVQEVAANAFTGFGPAGAAAGIAAAAGIGILVSKAQEAADKISAAKEGVIDLANELEEVGGDPAALDWAQRMRDTLTEITDDRHWWEFWQDEPKTRLEEWKTAADDLGVSMHDMVKGVAGDTDALARVQDELNDKWDEASRIVQDYRAAGDDATQSQKDAAMAAELTRMQISDLRDELENQTGQVSEAKEMHDLLTDSLSGLSRASSEAAAATETYESSVVDSLTSAGQSWQQYAEGGKVNLDAYNANIEAHARAVQQFEDNLVAASANLSAEALNYIKSLGPEAAPLLQAFVDAPLEQKKRTATNWDALGRAATDGYAQSLKLSEKTATAVQAAQKRADQSPIKVRATVKNDLQSMLDKSIWALRIPEIRVPFRAVQKVD